MTLRSSKDVEALFREGSTVDRAVQAAFYDAVRRHRQGNVPMVFWEDGRVVHRSPFDIPIPEDGEAEAAPE